MEHSMKIGAFDHLDASGAPLSVQYSKRLRLIEACDRVGLHAYHVAEHHGTPHGFASAPNLFLAAAAARTTRIRLGPMVMPLPLYHPLRAFEEICMLDQISRGRLDVGIGTSGVPMEHRYFGISPKEADARYHEAVEILLRAMAEGELTHHGRCYDMDDVPIVLGPYQKPHPPLWCGTTRPATAASAARRGMNIISLGRAAMIRQVTDAYREAWPASPRRDGATTPLLGIMRMIVVAETQEAAYSLARPAYQLWFHTLTALWRRHDVRPPYELTSEIDDAIEAGICLLGPSTPVAEQLLGHIEESGANYVSGHIAFGNLPIEAAIDTAAALQADVAPLLGMHATG